MRMYILTKYERKIIEAYLEKDLNLNGFNVLKLRVDRAVPTLKKDLELLEKFQKKFELNKRI